MTISASTPERSIRLSLMVAMANNRCIGLDNALPWHLPDDLKRFKATTLGKPIIMGRKTFESIGRPLPGRPNIVISRNQQWQAKGYEQSPHIHRVASAQQAVDLAALMAKKADVDEAIVIGGGQIYAELMPLVERMYVTAVNIEVTGDAFFPEFSQSVWQLTKSEARKQDESHAFPFAFQQWDRL